MANIEARVLVELLLTSPRACANGLLILSGILASQDHDVAAAFRTFTLQDAPSQEEWIALVLKSDPRDCKWALDNHMLVYDLRLRRKTVRTPRRTAPK